jgi:hypothetical protein
MRHAASNSYLPKNAPSFSRHFQGAFLDGGYPGLKPWAEFWPPFRGEMLARSPKLTPMGTRSRAIRRGTSDREAEMRVAVPEKKL